jgi:hypothetical protein
MVGLHVKFQMEEFTVASKSKTQKSVHLQSRLEIDSNEQAI